MPKNRKRRKPSTENENPNTVFLKRMLWGGAFSVAIFLILLLILSLFIVNLGVSDSMQNILVFFLSVLSTFLGDFITLRKTYEKGLISGVLSAIPAIIIMCIILLIVLHTLGLKTLIMAALMLLGGALGGIAAVNK